MRDINRIDAFLEQLSKYWKKVPDWRFGQLINNLQYFSDNDLFYMEEDSLIELLKRFFDDKIDGD